MIVQDLALSNDGALVALANVDEAFLLLDAATGRELAWESGGEGISDCALTRRRSASRPSAPFRAEATSLERAAAEGRRA